MLRWLVTASATGPMRESVAIQAAPSASPIIVGPDSVPPGRILARRRTGAASGPRRGRPPRPVQPGRTREGGGEELVLLLDGHHDLCPRSHARCVPSITVSVAPPTHTCPRPARPPRDRPGRCSGPGRRRSSPAACPSSISHCAALACRLPVTGSSATPTDAANARTSSAGSAPPVAPTTPTFGSDRSAAWSGSSARTAAASVSCRVSHAVPLSSSAARRTAPRLDPERAEDRRERGRRRARSAGGRRRREGERRAACGPAPARLVDCCTTTSVAAGRPPAASQAWQVPRVGWPAKSSSPPGVRMRTS